MKRTLRAFAINFFIFLSYLIIPMNKLYLNMRSVLMMLMILFASATSWAEEHLSVSFYVGSQSASIVNNMQVAKVTVDDEYYELVWKVTCAEDPGFYHQGYVDNLEKGQTYIVIASTPSSKPIVLNGGYHYTFKFQLQKNGWDLEYADEKSFEVVGTGAEATKYNDEIKILSIGSKETSLGYIYQDSYEVVFSAPVKNVKAYVAMGMDGSVNLTASRVDAEGKVWKVTLPETMRGEEGGFQIHITANDMNGIPLNGTFGVDHSFTFNISTTLTADDIPAEDPEETIQPDPDPAIVLSITKTEWNILGNENGEVVGSVHSNIDPFHHFESSISCQEDPDQFIPLAMVFSTEGNLVCTTWANGHYDLNAGYHYTLTVRAYDVPFYGAEPVAVSTYSFVGEGVSPTNYADITVASISLEENDLLYHGYNISTESFDITFSESISKVKAWWAKGFDGSQKLSVAQKSDDGKVWTITFPEGMLGSEEGSISVMIQAWDIFGIMAKGNNGDNAFDYNLIVTQGSSNEDDNQNEDDNNNPDETPDDPGTDNPDDTPGDNPTNDPTIDDGPEVAIKAPSIPLGASTKIYTLSGVRINASQMQKGKMYIINGKKKLFITANPNL